MNRSDCYRLERQLPGGFRTREEKAPFHGAREIRARLRGLTGRVFSPAGEGEPDAGSFQSRVYKLPAAKD